MVWALLALLGVPLWLIVGGLTGALISRRRFQQQPGVFPMRLQESSQADKWGRKVHARWVHDVLLVNSGLALVRTRAYAIAEVLNKPATQTDSPIKGLGEKPAILRFVLDDRTTVQIATSSEQLHLAKGPPLEVAHEPTLD